MVVMIINPGTEGNPRATIDNALAISERIASDLKISVVRDADAAKRDRNGFFGFVAIKNGRRLDLDIPGDDPDEFFESRPFRSRRMYVDGSSWLWNFAAGIIDEKLDGTHPVLLGTGVLTWTAIERRSDRYGSVYLIGDGHNSLSSDPTPSLIDKTAAARCGGRIGDLIAIVKIARKSTHIGDLFRGVFPSTPHVGEIIPLGSGTLFCESAPHGGFGVGLRPDDGRDTDWLKIEALYRAHEQTVDLFFQEVE